MMQILTTTGYKNIEDCSIGEQLIAYDINDGHEIVNELLGKEWMSSDLFQDLYQDTYDENGNTISTLVQTKEELYIDTYGDVPFYKINDTWILYGNQSIWANLNVVHVKDLQVGDTVYNGTDGDVIITSIEQVTGIGWWRLSVSGDHSYIADNLTLHNASRYWVGGGSSSAWSAITNTNWGSVSGGANNASVPTSVDDVTFDGVGANGNTPSLISSSFTILSLNITAGYTSTMTHNSNLIVAGNLTLTTGYTIAGTGRIRVSAATAAINMNGKTWPNIFEFGGAGTITLNSNLTVNGGIVLQNTVTLAKATSQIITTTGLTMATSYIFNGTVDVYLTGGAWSGTGNFNIPIYLNGNVTISGTLNYGVGPLIYSSGTITTTNSTLNILSNCTLNTSAITWNNFSVLANATVTLTSNLNIAGLSTFSPPGLVSINRTTSEIVTFGGGVSITNASVGGSAAMYLTGGTLSCALVQTPIGSSNGVFINGNVTLGSIAALQNTTLTLLSGSLATAGNTLGLLGAITFHASLSGITWNNITTTTVGVTMTINHTLKMSGTLTNNILSTINTTSGLETVIVGNGISVGGAVALRGTAEVIVTGGTISTDPAISTSAVVTPLSISGTVTMGQICSFGGNFKIYTGDFIVGTNTLVFNGANITTPILDSSFDGKSWYNVGFYQASVTLNHNLNISNALSTSGSSGSVIGKTTSEVVNTGGMQLIQLLSGTADIYLTGGTWETATTAYHSNNLFINGNITLGSLTNPFSNIGGGTFTYQSGVISLIAGHTTRIFGSYTHNSVGFSFNNFTTSAGATITLNSDLTVNGLLTTSSGVVVNKTNNEKLILYGGMSNTGTISGTGDVYLRGGTWSQTTIGYLSSPIFLDGFVTLSGNIYYGGSGTLTYNSGIITSTGAILNLQTSTINNFHKIPLRQVIITAGLTITMNEFFTGTASQICQVNSTGANYNITFSDGFEKIAKNVAVLNATITNRQQLLVLTRYKSNFNRGTNIGVRYHNQSPNGFSKNETFISGSKNFAPMFGLVSDPNFVKQA